VDGVVELPVSSSAEAMDGPAPGGRLDGGDARLGGELVPIGEPTDIIGVAVPRLAQAVTAPGA
jgi:hypothetical protein